MKSVLQIAVVAFVAVSIIAIDSSAQGVRPPVLIRLVAFNYPSSANSEVADERVAAIVIVNADGTVRDVTIKDPARTPLEGEIVKVVRKWVFIPAMKGGHAVACQILIPFSFESHSGELIADLGHYNGE